MNRRRFGQSILAAAAMPAAAAGVTRYIRYEYRGRIEHGVEQGEEIRALDGEMLGNYRLGASRKRADIRRLYPIVPPKVLAVGLNYRSHLGQRTPPPSPEIFYKPTTCLQHPDAPIRIPAGAKNVHFEGELVVVIGSKLSGASREQAQQGVFGVTCGNDVSERDWQNGEHKDLQWWRAKGADTFGPMGPAIVAGLDYGRLMLETRLNGKTMQKQSTSDLLFDVPAIVSFISRYVTLTPGDVIYTGTPGSTAPMKPGDVVEVEIEGIGVLRNPVMAAS